MFTELKDSAIFIGNNKRKIEALRVFERGRQNFDSKVLSLQDTYKLSSSEPWKVEFDKLDSFEERYFDCKSYAVMFSGGFDSLALAIKHLENKERVYLLSVGFNCYERCSAWLSAQILKLIYGKNNVKFIRLFGDIVLDGEGTPGLTQQPFCAFYATYMPDAVRRNIKAVECAYVQNDTAISYLQEISQIYNYSMKCHMATKSFPPMRFPMAKTEHWENINYVGQIENKYNVMFPALSAYFIETKMLHSDNGDTAYIVKAKSNSEEHNKTCDVCGYVFLEHNSTKSLESSYYTIAEDADDE